MPELPAPPSSSDDEYDVQGTPIRERRSLLADFTAAKTPRPPGAWAPTPAPAEKAEKAELNPLHAAPPLPPEAETPTPAAGSVEPSVVVPTPAPPGAWQPTPVGSMRRKSILKVRFEEQNTSGESMPEVPIVGPGTGTGTPATENMSDIFPPLMPLPHKEQPPPQQQQQQHEEPKAKGEPERPNTPPTVRARRFRSPGMKLVDPYGNEIVEDSPEPSISSSMQSEESMPDPPPAQPSRPAYRAKRPMKIVDAMGREVKEEDEEPSVVMQPVEVKDEEVDPEDFRPMSRRESITRLRDAISQMAEDFGESDE